MIKEIYKTKLSIDNADILEERFISNLPGGTIIVNNHNKSFLITSSANISKDLFEDYNYFDDIVKPLFAPTDIPINLLYNILPLGNNSYLLQF